MPLHRIRGFAPESRHQVETVSSGYPAHGSPAEKLLNAAANRVKPGGILVYAVCSGEPEENEQVVTAF